MRSVMRRCKLNRLVGLCSATYGLGIISSYFFPGFLLSFFLAAALVTAGLLLLSSSK